MASTTPNRAALELAHRMLRVTTPLDDTLNSPVLRGVLDAVARGDMWPRAQADVKNRHTNQKSEDC